MFRIRSLLCIIVLVMGLSCSHGGDSESTPLLLENSRLLLHGTLLNDALIISARRFCHKHPLLDYVPEGVAALGNIRTALHMLNHAETIGSKPPVAIYATYGTDSNMKPYMAVWAINTNRETEKIHIVARGPNDDPVSITLVLSLKEKDLGFVDQHYYRVTYVSWDTLSSLAMRDKNGRNQVVITGSDPIPFPRSEKCAAAIEDRKNGLSNFVPVTEFIYTGELYENKMREFKGH